MLFDTVFLDIPTVSGNTNILTKHDDLIKYSLGVPLPNNQANIIAEVLVDQDTEFLSKTFTKICKLLIRNKINISTIHPQPNGSLKRSHRTFNEYLRYYVSKNLNTWNRLLTNAFFAYN